jgi:(R,R)-butanediol dehydrogenase / meso-butanediol dehydrogenase / diacetyl reductase
VAVAVHGVRRAELLAGDQAVVIGGGPIGALIAVVARRAGAEVLVMEISGERRRRIADLGFQALDPSTTDPAAWVEKWTRGAGADAVFEVSGAASAVLGATDLLKVDGTIVLVAIHIQPRPVDLHRVFLRELRIVGVRVYRRSDFERAVELLGTGAIPADAIISHIKPITATAQAFTALQEGSAMKVLIDVRAT